MYKSVAEWNNIWDSFLGLTNNAHDCLLSECLLLSRHRYQLTRRWRVVSVEERDETGGSVRRVDTGMTSPHWSRSRSERVRHAAGQTRRPSAGIVLCSLGPCCGFEGSGPSAPRDNWPVALLNGGMQKQFFSPPEYPQTQLMQLFGGKKCFILLF